MNALGSITMQLIQGYRKEEGNLGIDRPDSFPLGVEFLSETACAPALDNLYEVSILSGLDVGKTLTLTESLAEITLA